MSYKFDSMIRILNMLDRKETITRGALAKMLGVNIRSADRYIATLRNADFPISFDENRGSYVFDEGFSLSRSELMPEEKLALGLAKGLAAKFGPKTGKALEAVERKMTTCSFSLPGHIKFSGQDMPPEVEEHFRRLNYAITNLSLCEMDYHTAYRGGEKTHRIVEPCFLFYQEGVWYLRAFCRLKKEPRLFALDRMENLTVLDRHFLPKPEITSVDLNDAFVDGEPVDAVLRFDKVCAPYLERYRNRKPKTLPDGRIEMRYRTNGTKGLKLWLYRFLPCVEVVSPKELKEEIRKELTEAAGKI
jgi:predicted DNA-binding transcriptional regulator YafY